MTATVRPLTKRTRERLAACEAVNLHYWADHPSAGHVWAVDGHQRAHVVRISRSASTAQHVCQAASSDEAEQCAGAAEAVAFTVQEETEKRPPLMNESGPDTNPRVDQEDSPMTNTPPATEQYSPNGSGPATEPAPNPLDPARYRLDSIADIEVEKVLTTVSIRKPKRTEFFRVHPGRDYTEDMALLERSDGMDRETYLVDPAVQHLVLSELRQVRLFTVINKHGEIFLWPVKLPSDDHDRIRRMADSALQGAEQAKTLWVKLVWDKHLGAWEMYRAAS